jgi:hypothetical protein
MENSTAFSRGSALVGSRAGADELCINAIRVLAIDAVQVILIATGSEVSPALEAHARLAGRDPQPGRVNALLGVVRSTTGVVP